MALNLRKISKRDKYWRSVAFKICKDKSIADDLVQEMYLKVYTITKEINDYYIISIINSKWIDICRKKNKTIHLDSLFYLEDKQKPFEPNDYELQILENVKQLDYHKQEFLAESYDRSLRAIEKVHKVNYGFVYRELKKAKEEVLNGVKPNEYIKKNVDKITK